MSLNSKIRNDLKYNFFELLLSGTYNTTMTKFNRLQDSDRYHNWYHGFTEIALPTFDYNDADAYETYSFNSHASTGEISTQYFGEKFNMNKVVKNVQYNINITGPNNSILHLEVEKVSMKRISSNYGFDNLRINGELVDPDQTFIIKNITDGHVEMRLERNVSDEDMYRVFV